MKFRTIVDIPQPGFKIEPCERMLFVGSCFAAEMGKRFAEERFRVTVNPFGTMYNPASILHTVVGVEGEAPQTVVLTLGTNHVYILNETGEIVDNCQKRPQKLFTERELSVEECTTYLQQVVDPRRENHRHGQSHPLCEIWIPWQPVVQSHTSFGYRPTMQIHPWSRNLFSCLRNHQRRVAGLSVLRRRHAPSLRTSGVLYMGKVLRMLLQ